MRYAHPMELPAIDRRTPHYLVMFKLYVKPTGDITVVMGNVHMEVSHDEVHALLCGTLDLACVFKKLHEQVDATTLEILTDAAIVGATLAGSDGQNGNGA